MSRPWFKFSPKSWRSDPNLRMCSLAARGLWADLLSYMHEGAPYGFFLIDGKQPDLNQTASLVGRPIKEVRAALGELEGNGVFSRREDGAMYSRRMVKDNAKEQLDITNGKGGGNPKLTGHINGGVNPQSNQPDKAKTREERGKNSEREEQDAADAAPDDQKTALYRRGKEILGANSGGLITKLVKAKGTIPLARAALEQASEALDAREYIGGILNKSQETARERGEAW